MRRRLTMGFHCPACDARPEPMPPPQHGEDLRMHARFRLFAFRHWLQWHIEEVHDPDYVTWLNTHGDDRMRHLLGR